MSDERAINYDKLLSIFVGNDELRPALCQANTVGDKTYSTDAHALIILDTSKLIGSYPAHPNVPNYGLVITQLVECEELFFTDTSLFKALEKFPKEYDTSPCETCDGDGSCPHCHQPCTECDGSGHSEDKSLPMIYTYDAGYIVIGEHFFSPFQLGRLEKVLLEMMEETFSIIRKSKNALMFKVRDVEIIIMKMMNEENESRPTVALKPIKS